MNKKKRKKDKQFYRNR